MKSDSHLPKKLFALLIALKNDEKCPLFHLEIFSFSRDLNFCFDFLIRKIRLLSKFNTSQPVNKQLQYTNHPISHEVKSQTMKLKKYFCAKNYAENEAGRLLPDPFLLIQKRFI